MANQKGLPVSHYNIPQMKDSFRCLLVGLGNMTKILYPDITYFISRYNKHHDVTHFVTKCCHPLICIINNYANVSCTKSQLDAVEEK